MHRLLAWGLALLACAGLVAPGRAQAELGAAGTAPGPRTAPFWRAAHDPDSLRADSLVRQARSLLYPALGRSSFLGNLGQAKRLAIEAALARLAMARRMDPSNLEALYLTGLALAQWEARVPAGAVQRRDGEAIRILSRLSALAPTFEPYEIAFELAILYTRVERFDRARDAWQRALDVHLGELSVPTVYSNLAEVTMMAGDLPEAAELYTRAVELGDGEARLLPMWGLAVVLDRMGEHAEALQWAQRALTEDQRPMGVLRAPGVFFVPQYEVHYYTGLGQLAEASEAHGRAIGECSSPLSSEAAIRGATREGLQHVVRLGEQLRALAPDLTALAPLGARALSVLTERNRIARRQGAETRDPSREADAFVDAMASLRDFHRYLAEGGAEGAFAEAARTHTADLERCLGLSSGRRSAPGGAQGDGNARR